MQKTDFGGTKTLPTIFQRAGGKDFKYVIPGAINPVDIVEISLFSHFSLY